MFQCVIVTFNLTKLYAFFVAAHVDNEVYLGRALERLGDAALKEQEPDIGAAFLKFAVVTKELSALMKTLVRVSQAKFTRVTKYSAFSVADAPPRPVEYISLLVRFYPCILYADDERIHSGYAIT